ncbi:lipoprotein [Streptomyces fuscichromogenes]|uniref:Lipoprotein n=2 Tax=Streptomyces fuscichromogenes TaxID=1324013 RepID=A0A917XQ07_9ACTN|nr:lipoprotein [Streptomyces fuscichromogenes]
MKIAAGALVLASLLSACGSTQAAQPGSAPKASTTLNSVPSLNVSERNAEAAAPTAVSVRVDGNLKSVVVDENGKTLYVSAKDKAASGKSSCDDTCAKTMVPVPADDVTPGTGINKDLLGSITRVDGSKQLTLGGKPLYSYAEDEAGETKGQGFQKTWYAAAPDGAKAGVSRPALGVLDSPKLGRVLQDKNGHTLYLFTKDTPWPMQTACDATCLQKWTPSAPVTAADAKAVGLSPEILFTFTTPNGTKQESFNCWPAYTFKGDKAPGQTNGQGVGGVWFAIKADIPKSDRGKTVPAAGRDQY